MPTTSILGSFAWITVRVIRYRQHKPNVQVVEAEWLTDFPAPGEQLVVVSHGQESLGD